MFDCAHHVVTSPQEIKNDLRLGHTTYVGVAACSTLGNKPASWMLADHTCAQRSAISEMCDHLPLCKPVTITPVHICQTAQGDYLAMVHCSYTSGVHVYHTCRASWLACSKSNHQVTATLPETLFACKNAALILRSVHPTARWSNHRNN